MGEKSAPTKAFYCKTIKNFLHTMNDVLNRYFKHHRYCSVVKKRLKKTGKTAKNAKDFNLK